MVDITGLMRKAKEMQDKMQEVKAKMDETEVEGSAAGGMVKVVMNGKGEAKKISFDSSLIVPDDKEVLEDLAVVAFNDAKAKIEQKMAEEMGKVSSDLGLPAGMPSLF